MAAKSTPWIAGAGVVSLVIAAGAWFVAISPTLSNAAAQRDAAQQQQDHNAMLQVQIANLKAQFAHIGDYQAQIEALRTKVPGTTELAELTRQIQSIADSNGVTVTVDSPGMATAFVAPAAAAPAPTPTASAVAGSSDTTSVDNTGSSAPAKASTTLDGLFQVPVTVTTIGTYDATVNYLDALQQSLPRLYVVTGFAATAQTQAGGQNGMPATNPGDLQTVINGYALTLTDQSAAQPTPTPAPTATTLPVPGGQRNPFLPLGQ